jgi:acetylcholinesterase
MTALSSLKSRFDRLSPTTKYWLVMFFRVSPLIALIALAIGLGFIPPSSSSALLAVQDGSTTYTGSCDGSVCSWYGLRYAAAPIGNLRFAPPQPPPTPPATKRATAKKAMCPQGGSIDLQNEDCLYLNIQRPARVNLATKLPVLVFIHGGGFESGSGNQNSPAAMIELGAAYGQEAVVVRINYRLGLFGFLAGTELEAERDDNANNVGLNRGFQDMGMAMKWVQAHIEAFGGDSTKITIWGQSAGSFGASAQLLAHADTAPPFQAAILESGSPGGVPIDPVSVKDAQYNRVLMSTNCSSTADHLSCLRSVPWKIMRTISLQESSRASQAATLMRGFYAWTGVIDGGPSKGGFFSSSPSAVISSGAYAKIPILQGDCLDEGTYFAPHTFDNTSELSTWLGGV